jgi:hypothetical protein
MNESSPNPTDRIAAFINSTMGHGDSPSIDSLALQANLAALNPRLAGHPEGLATFQREKGAIPGGLAALNQGLVASRPEEESFSSKEQTPDQNSHPELGTTTTNTRHFVRFTSKEEASTNATAQVQKDLTAAKLQAAFGKQADKKTVDVKSGGDGTDSCETGGTPLSVNVGGAQSVSYSFRVDPYWGQLFVSLFNLTRQRLAGKGFTL